MDTVRISFTYEQTKRYLWRAGIAWTALLAGFWLLHAILTDSVSLPMSGVIGAVWLAGMGIIGVAAQKVKLAARVQRQAEKTARAQSVLEESLHDSAIILNSTLELNEALDRILENVARVAPYDTANIILFEEGIARIVRTRGYVERGLEDSALHLRFPVHDIPSFQKMMASGKPYVVMDTQTDPDWDASVRAYGPRSYAGAPVILKGETIGFLNLNSNEPGFFTLAQAEKLGAFATQAAAAIRNAQMYEKLRESEAKLQSRLRQQAAVAQLGQMALSQTDLFPLFDETVTVVADVLDVAFCKILERLPDGDALLLRAGVGWRDGLVGQAVVGADLDSQAGYTLLSNEPVIVTDLTTDTRFNGPPLLVEHGVISGVSIVIQGRERPFGVLGAHTTQYREFTQDDVNFLQAAAHILAAAAARREAEETLRQNIRFLRLLNDITRTAASSLNLAEMLQHLADRLGELFNADGCYITLWDEAQQKPLPAASYGPLRDVYPTLQAEPGERTMTESVVQAGRPLVAEDVFNTPYLSRRIAEMFPTRSMLGLPLVAGGQKLGAALVSFHQTRRFTPDEIARGEQSAAQVALAIARVRLFEEVQRQAAQLEQLVAKRTIELEDVSQELRQAQEELVRQEKMAVLGQLAGSVAHELRNPLGAMRNAVYALNMLLEAPAPDVVDLLYVLNSEIDVSVSIIGSLLAYASHQPPLQRSVDINEIARQAVANTAVPPHIQIVYRLDGTLPFVYADPTLLIQVFSHIIRNAVQSASPPYAPEGDARITIQTELPEPDTVAISFADTGVGIPPENMDKLFEPLFSTKAKGIGLGLPLAKTMIENQDGRIEVSSEGGKGAVFTVYLPVDKGKH
ncbi:MAG: GAF domain-containing protein [Chloroflexi bacterium]|nr:GAF domain-containing protein [Chloroflexota bacterium]